MDGKVPIAGMTIFVVGPSGNKLGYEVVSDQSGLAEMRALAQDSYTLRLEKSDCWPAQAQVEARQAGDPEPVQVRRLGDLELKILSADGLPVNGLAVNLTSVEFETAVSRWIEEGRVKGDGLVTDVYGGIGIERLPRGLYRWGITRAGEAPFEGECEVLPGAVTTRTIRLP